MKRSNGTGSIVKLPGNRRRPYAVRISGRNEYGHIIQKNLSYHEKAADAQAALEAYNAQRAAGTAPRVDKMDLTVGQVHELWKAREYRKLNPPSIGSYNAAWNKRVSRFADVKFRQIFLDDWQSLIDEDEDKGLSQSTINNDVALIKGLSSFAMERDIIMKNYSQYIDIPTVDVKNPRNALSDAQMDRLSEMAAEGVPWADTALILCYTGFRVSAFLALTRTSYHTEDGGYLQGGVKTEAGKNRRIPVHPKIQPYLAAWLAKGGDTIICDDAGKAISPVKYREYFSALMERLDVPNATPHWCRHTFATRLHRAKADALVVKWLMGHSTKSDITAHYTHETMRELQEAILLLS